MFVKITKQQEPQFQTKKIPSRSNSKHKAISNCFQSKFNSSGKVNKLNSHQIQSNAQENIKMSKTLINFKEDQK